jgi:hypothetical protein
LPDSMVVFPTAIMQGNCIKILYIIVCSVA